MTVRSLARTALVATGLALAAPGAARAQVPTRTTWSGVFSREQAERGKEVYQTGCARCHGAALQGEEIVPALTGGAFTASWNGLTLGDLFERIRTSMPYDDPGTLTRQQNADVIAYILSVSGFPTGQRELASRAEALKLIAFEATRATR